MRNLFLYFPLASRMGFTQFSYHFSLLEAKTLPLRNELLALIAARHVLKKLEVSDISPRSNYYQIEIGACEKILYAFHTWRFPIRLFVHSLLSIAASKTNQILEVNLVVHNGRWTRFDKNKHLIYPGLRVDEARRSLNYILKTLSKALNKEDKQLFRQTVQKLKQLEENMEETLNTSLYIPHRLSLAAVPIVKGKSNSEKRLKIIRKPILINKIGILKSPKHNRVLVPYQKSRLVYAYEIQVNSYETSYATNLIPFTRVKLPEQTKRCFIDRYMRFEHVESDETYVSATQVFRKLGQPEDAPKRNIFSSEITYTIYVKAEFNC